MIQKIFEFFLWLGTLLYALGGIKVGDHYYLSYIGDLVVFIAIFYAVFRLSQKLRFRDTLFAKSLDSLFQTLTQCSLEKSFSPLKKTSFPALVLLIISCQSVIAFILIPLFSVCFLP